MTAFAAIVRIEYTLENTWGSKNMRFILFQGLIDTLDLYTGEFVKILKEQDADCLVLDAGHMEREMLRLKAFLLQPVTAVLSFNNIGMHLELEDGKNIWDAFQIPFWNILMDHPFHYKKALDCAPEQTVLYCMDKNHAAYVKRFFPHIQKTEFLPHAGIPVKQEKDLLPIHERKIDVLYAGALSRCSAEGLVPDLGKITEFDAFGLVKDALEQLIQNPEQTTEQVIEQCLKDRKQIFDDKKLGEIISELRFVDSFAVSFYREQMVRVLAESGITVTVFGTGWDRCEWEHPKLVYGGEIPPRQILEMMNQSRVVLNTMTWFKRGAHDRIFNGMLAGAAVASDTSEYIQEHFPDSRELQVFSLKEIYRLPEMIKALLDHTDDTQQMADCGYRAAAEHHTWKNRLNNMLNHK